MNHYNNNNWRNKRWKPFLKPEQRIENRCGFNGPAQSFIAADAATTQLANAFCCLCIDISVSFQPLNQRRLRIIDWKSQGEYIERVSYRFRNSFKSPSQIYKFIKSYYFRASHLTNFITSKYNSNENYQLDYVVASNCAIGRKEIPNIHKQTSIYFIEKLFHLTFKAYHLKVVLTSFY